MLSNATLESLQFPDLLQLLKQYAQTPFGQEKIVNLLPSTTMRQVNKNLDLVKEYISLRAFKGSFSFEGIKDIRYILTSLDSSGIILAPSDIRDLYSILKVTDEILAIFDDVPPGDYELPLLRAVISPLETRPQLRLRIEQTIGVDGEILDSASPALKKIRRKIQNTRETIYDRLHRFMNRPSYAPSIQDTIITQRNQRFVIPIRVEDKAKINGIIHDQSASGATLFIEPMDITPMNNALLQERLNEEKEIRRILTALTDELRIHRQVFSENLAVITELDFLQAKGHFAMKIKANRPEIVPDAGMTIYDARHPLLLHYLGDEKTVPIDIRINENSRLLLLSGPNMGGKTVALKTAGLLSLMVQSGLWVPASPSSRFPVFQSYFTDIGDMQDISQSLSTFASHLVRLKEILDNAGPDSFVLIDELGTGTDPDEGDALGQMILNEMYERKAVTIATTHLSHLKQKTLQQSENMVASVLFDPVNCKPLYQLEYGQFGQSNAFGIAENFGIQKVYIEKARSLMNPRQLELERLLTHLDQKRTELDLIADTMEKEKEKIASDRENMIAEIEKMKDETRGKSEKLLEQVRERVRFIHQELTEQRKRALAIHVEDMPHFEELSKVSDEMEVVIEKELPKPKPKKQKKQVKPIPPAPLEIGSEVHIEKLKKSGIVTELFSNKKTAQISVSGFKMTLPIEDLKVIAPQKKELDSQISIEVDQRDYTVENKLNLLGERVDSALDRLDKYLDEAYLNNLFLVRIIHGIGEEKLRPAIHEALRSNPLVATFRPGTQTEGGFGVTVVDLSNPA